MNSYRMLVVVAMVLIQVSGANAQFGGLGDIVKKAKDLNKPAKKTENPPAQQSVPDQPANPPAQKAAPDQPDVKEDYSTPRGCFDTIMGTKDTQSRSQAFSQLDRNSNKYQKGGFDKGECHYYIAECYIRGMNNGYSKPIYGADISLSQTPVECIKRAIPKYKDAAELQNVPALVKLSEIFADERSELKDLNKSLSNLALAAKLGDKASIDKLSQLYAAGFAGVSDESEKDKSVVVLAGVGNHDAQIVVSNKLAAAEALKKQQAALDEALKQKQQEEARLAAEKALQEQHLTDVANSKEIQNAIEHPMDLFGMGNSRYRKFDGKIYDCVEPIAALNKYFSYLPMVDKYGSENDKAAVLYSQIGAEIKNEDNTPADKMTEVQKALKNIDKSLRSSQWYKKKMDYVLTPPFVVRQVTSDGLIVEGNAGKFLLKNHPKQKGVVDGDVLTDTKVWFALKTKPFQFTDVSGAVRTIKSYDMGIVVPPPSGSVPKLPAPEAD